MTLEHGFTLFNY